MRANASARYLVKVLVIMACAALAALVGFEVSISESLAAQIAQTTGRQTDDRAVPNVTLSDLMAAAR